MGKFIDLTGHRYGRLVVIERAENNKHGISQFLCQCDCGNKKIICGKFLRDGDTISCGCFRKEVASNTHRKHGFRETRLYHVWQDIKTLCYNPNDSRYKYYGGRGIIVCDEWKDNFQAFYDWAIESGYKEEIQANGYNKWTIERIDNNGNYEPDNCCWATMEAQCNNTRRNRLIKYKGADFTVAQVAKERGLRGDTLLWRINNKTNIQEAIETPVKHYRKKNENLSNPVSN